VINEDLSWKEEWSMIDPMIQRLLEKAIDTPVKLHLLLIFHENVRMEATASAVADRVCRDIWSVSQALDELVEDGVMGRSVSPAGDLRYRYAPHPENHEPIKRLIAGYDDPIERDLLQRLIRDLSTYAAYRRSSAWEYQIA
jgi:DNA-binding MarR family transcriptional regulator